VAHRRLHALLDGLSIRGRQRLRNSARKIISSTTCEAGKAASYYIASTFDDEGQFRDEAPVLRR